MVLERGKMLPEWDQWGIENGSNKNTFKTWIMFNFTTVGFLSIIIPPH